MANEDMGRTGAIVCREVAEDNAPILYAKKDKPLEPEDSGWQFLCGSGKEDPLRAQVWLLREVLEREPSLKRLMDQPVGTILRRANGDAWRIERA